MEIINTRQDKIKFNHIARSHQYWGRKPTNSLFKVLDGLKKNDVFIDPFCGGGTPASVALTLQANVLASDLNPMAILLTKVLIKPISIFSLNESFEKLKKLLKEKILSPYMIKCPRCHKQIYFDYIMWDTKYGQDMPEAVKVSCKHCRLNKLNFWGKEEITRQIKLSLIKPNYLYPNDKINSKRKINKTYFYELFTGRNLSALSELLHNINTSHHNLNIQY